MAWTTSDVEKLEAAIASGELLVRFGDRTVQYQNTDAMLRARREMLQEIRAVAGTSRRKTFRVTQSGTGL